MLNVAPEIKTSRAPLPRLSYSLTEAGEILGLSYVSVWRLAKAGKLRITTPLPRKPLVTHAELERFLKAHEVAA
jgi:predicted site-specific integrase-resolvase